MQKAKKLNLGSGTKKIEGYINVDKSKHKNVDIIHDLDIIPYPFEDSTINSILFDDSLEHLENPFNVLCECHRILIKNGIVEIYVPHKNSYGAYMLSHKRLFNEYSFKDIEFKDTGFGLQHKPLFKIEEITVKRLIPTPFGFYLKGFNIYHNSIGIGFKNEMYVKLRKMVV
jgi:SAM-dependent methyltransferase